MDLVILKTEEDKNLSVFCGTDMESITLPSNEESMLVELSCDLMLK